MGGRKPAAKPTKQGQKAQEGSSAAEPSTMGDDMAQLGRQELASAIKCFKGSLKSTLGVRPAAHNLEHLAQAATPKHLRKKNPAAAGQSSRTQDAAGKPDDEFFDVLAALDQLINLQD